jgi:hypothetical protein
MKNKHVAYLQHHEITLNTMNLLFTITWQSTELKSHFGLPEKAWVFITIHVQQIYHTLFGQHFCLTN